MYSTHGQRFFLGLDKRSPLSGIDGEMPLTPTHHRRLIDGVRLYNQLVQLPNDRLVSCIYRTSRRQECKGWTSSIKNHLNWLGFEQEWAEQKVVNLSQLKIKLHEEYETMWKSCITSKPKLRTYRLFKEKPETAQQVLSHMPKAQRSLITRLWIGTLPIELELGRKEGKAVVDRICKICQTEVEDEYHLLFDCNAYHELQKPWLKQLKICTLPNSC